MSVRTELEELVKWISELSEEETPAPEPEHLTRDVWEDVAGDLRRAAVMFAKAREALLAAKPKTPLAEFARDLERETESLAFRAQVLARRAKPKGDEPRQMKVPAEDQAAAQDQAPDAKAQDEASDAGKATPAAGPKPAAPKPPSTILRSAAKTIETAGTKIDVEHPDEVIQTFDEELDVLAEMALSLRLQAKWLEDELEQPKAKG